MKSLRHQNLIAKMSPKTSVEVKGRTNNFRNIKNMPMSKIKGSLVGRKGRAKILYINKFHR
jgi:hypothetical protein